MRGAAIAKNINELKGCVTPYVKGQNATCTTEEKAKHNFTKMRKLKDDSLYLMPCHLPKTQLLLESKSVDTTGWNWEDGNNQTLILNLPSTVISTETSFSYSFLSFLAEFGSWLGLFTGLSVVQVPIHIAYKNFIYHISGPTAFGISWNLVCKQLR